MTKNQKMSLTEKLPSNNIKMKYRDCPINSV